MGRPPLFHQLREADLLRSDEEYVRLKGLNDDDGSRRIIGRLLPHAIKGFANRCSFRLPSAIYRAKTGCFPKWKHPKDGDALPSFLTLFSMPSVSSWPPATRG
jgi:hypothetical protein